jgi:hypothetical protein
MANCRPRSAFLQLVGQALTEVVDDGLPAAGLAKQPTLPGGPGLYMVMVNEKGTVDNVEFSGASAYSGSVIDTYPALIRELKFEPGRKAGRKVRCRVVVWVHHTFVDAKPRT